MKTPKVKSRRMEHLRVLSLICLFTLALISCKNEKKEDQKVEEIVETDPRITIKTVSMDFQMPDTITSGWNTFLYLNESPQTHFFAIEKYPEGITLDSIKLQVLPYFDSGMKLINEGKSEEGFAEFGHLPSWFGGMQVLGGSGLLSPGHHSETTLKLEPGVYFIECYVKMSNGMFHSSMGMLRDFVVSDSPSGNKFPLEDVSIDISSLEGIVINDSISSGEQIFSVFFKDQIVHENFSGHDVNLVKLDEGANLVELENWMNWADPKGLIEPAPRGMVFLGGVNNMPAGNKGFFKAELVPGNYALVAEVPGALDKNMLKTFSIGD